MVLGSIVIDTMLENTLLAPAGLGSLGAPAVAAGRAPRVALVPCRARCTPRHTTHT
jgi:hypothetical protein